MSQEHDDEWREQAEKDLAGLVAAMEEIHQMAALDGTFLKETAMKKIKDLATKALEKHGGLVYD